MCNCNLWLEFHFLVMKIWVQILPNTCCAFSVSSPNQKFIVPLLENWYSHINLYINVWSYALVLNTGVLNLGCIEFLFSNTSTFQFIYRLMRVGGIKPSWWMGKKRTWCKLQVLLCLVLGHCPNGISYNINTCSTQRWREIQIFWSQLPNSWHSCQSISIEQLIDKLELRQIWKC